jgi:hypothetical protein
MANSSWVKKCLGQVATALKGVLVRHHEKDAGLDAKT